MVYLKRTTDIQMVFIPKNGRDAKGDVSFNAFSTINNFAFSFDAAEEGNSLLYYKMLVELKDNIPAGEYEYALSDKIGELSVGLLVVGELDSHVEHVIDKEYEQYEN